VHADLLGKDSWTNLRPVLLDLPPCRSDHDIDEPPSSCQQRRNNDDGNDGSWTSRERNQCGCCNTAHGIAATVVEDVEDGCSRSAATPTTSTVVVFAVNAGCPLPTRRFCDVVSAAEEHLLLQDRHDQGGLETGVRQRLRVLAAFCDGSSIIYYTASSGINTP
ncbi:unnamed protein product, partial [Laminaria digitata]